MKNKILTYNKSMDDDTELVVKKTSLILRVLKKIKCKFSCCSHSSCSINEDKE